MFQFTCLMLRVSSENSTIPEIKQDCWYKLSRIVGCTECLVYHIVRYFGEFWYFLRQQIIIMKARKKITTTFRRISLLLWKNILFRRKLLMILLTILEIVAPTLLVGGLAYYRTKVENDTGIKENNFTYFSTYPEEVCFNRKTNHFHTLKRFFIL